MDTTVIDRIANLQNDAWWEGRGVHLMHCGKEKDKICALDLPPSDMVYEQNQIRNLLNTHCTQKNYEE